MNNTYTVYQIINHRLKFMCRLSLSEEDIEIVSKGEDIGDQLFVLTPELVSSLSCSKTGIARVLSVSLELGSECAIDLKEPR